MISKTVKKIIPIILAGGTGTRLWPLSRKSFPKQFLNLLDNEYTMLQKTYINYISREQSLRDSKKKMRRSDYTLTKRVA